MAIDIPFLIGGIGMVIILTAFALNQLHKLERDSVLYDLLNLIGSGLLVFYALIIDGYPFVLLNGVWFLISLHDLVTDLKR